MPHKLGKLPARHDPRTLRLAKYLTPVLPPLPKSTSNAKAFQLSGQDFGMLLNDQLGDCVIAAMAHMEMIWGANSGTPFSITDRDLRMTYAAVSGTYDPITNEGDYGCTLLTALNYWRQTGIVSKRIVTYASVANDLTQIKQAINLFEGLFVGVCLPANYETSCIESDVWSDTTLDPVADNGHGICVLDFDDSDNTFTIGSWGRFYKVTYSWLLKYADEHYAPLSLDMLKNGEDLAGIDIATLRDDLSVIGDEAPALPAPPAVPDPDTRHVAVAVMCTGLGTDPTGDCCGMRALMSKLAAQHPEYNWKVLSFGWDQAPPAPFHNDPDGLCRYMMANILALVPSKVILAGHSFGGALVVFFLQWIWKWYSGLDRRQPPIVFDLVTVFDGVPNGWRFGEGQNPGWFLPLTVAPLQFSPYQRNGLVAFIKGEPLFVQGINQVIDMDVTTYRDPQLGHVDMCMPPLQCLIKDTRPKGVQEQFLSLATRALTGDSKDASH